MLFYGILLSIFLGWFFAQILCRAILTRKISSIWRGEKSEKEVSKTFSGFLPLFEMAILKKVLSPITFFTEFSFLFRYLSQRGDFLFLPFFLIGVVGIVILFLLSFTTQMIILRGKNTLESVLLSFQLVFSYFWKIFHVFLLFLLVEVRVFLNILLVLLFPMLLIGGTGFFAIFLSEKIGLLLSLCILLFFTVIASYIGGILFVFSEAIWTVAFLRFSEEKQKEESLSAFSGETPSLSP